jgi:hypothetical protein
MKKLILSLCATLSLGLGGVALAQNPLGHRVLVCHNATTYIDETSPEVPISHLLEISDKGRAIEKHVANHSDCTNMVSNDGPGQVCELVDGAVVCEAVTLCSCGAP